MDQVVNLPAGQRIFVSITEHFMANPVGKGADTLGIDSVNALCGRVEQLPDVVLALKEGLPGKPNLSQSRGEFLIPKFQVLAGMAQFARKGL